MLNPTLRDEIRTVVETALEPLDVVDVTVIEGEDYDANDVVFVTVDLSAETARIPGDQMLRAMNAVSEALLRSGDQRPPYFRTLREGEAELVDDEADVLS